ncbi:MAG TPA: hypothetical protein VEU76_02360 [Candidatus Udaeobacter sp.]|nr:hypothetical protein [Candidatus Udaeobacter sp.]
MSSSKKASRKPARARDEASRSGSSQKAARKDAPRRAGPAAIKAAKSAKPAPRPQPRPVPKAASPKPLPQRAARPVKPVRAAPQARPGAPSRPSIRLTGSASSRLTIKPGPPQGPRPQLELSTRPRPSGPRRLSEVDLEEDEVLIDGFDATLEGERVRITAVLERTCVYVARDGDRQLARKEELWVEADKLPIRRRGLG